MRGVLAGAAGTTALNATTYVDMVLRARPPSSTPEDTVKEIAHRVGGEIPGDEDATGNRVAGLGPLSGIATGVAVGVAAALLRHAGVRLPPAVAAAGIGLAAMAASDVPMAALGVTDLRAWSAQAWLSDVVPHLVYGAVTTASLTAMEPLD